MVSAVTLAMIGEQAVEPFIQALKEKDRYVRREAAFALGEIGDVRAVEPLIQSLEDEDLEVRFEATDALEKIREPAVDLLLRALKVGNKDVRRLVAWILGEIGDSRAIKPLIQALNDEDSDVQWRAAEALVKIGEPAVEQLIKILKDENGYIQWGAAETLEKIGKPAVEALSQALKDEEEGVRRDAAWALDAIGNARAVEPLIQALKDENRDVRRDVAWAELLMSDMLTLQKRKEIFDEIHAVFILTEGGICIFNYATQPKKLRADEQKLEMLGSLLSAINLFAREVGGGEVNHLKLEGASFYCLKQRFKTVALLFVTLAEPELLPEKAELFLKDMASLFTLNFGHIFEKGWEGNVSTFSNFDNLIFLRWGCIVEILNNFTQILKVENRDVRRLAAWILGEIGDSRAIKPLIQALNDEDSDVQWRAAEALVKIGEPAVEQLIQALKDENNYIRWWAAEALEKIGEPAVEALGQALKDEEEDEGVRRAVVWALGAIGDVRAAEPLIQALKDENRDVRRRAAWALRKIGDSSTVDLLLQALKDENRYARRVAAEVLGKIGGKRAVEPLVKALKDRDSTVRDGAVWALGKIGGKRALKPLIEALKDEDCYVRFGVVRVLEKLGWKPANDLEKAYYLLARGEWRKVAKVGEAAIETLKQVLNDEEYCFRESVKETLEKIKSGEKGTEKLNNPPKIPTKKDGQGLVSFEFR